MATSGAQQVLGGLDAALGVGEERAFEMNADGVRDGLALWLSSMSSGLRMKLGEACEGAQRCVERCGDRGGEVSCRCRGRREAGRRR